MPVANPLLHAGAIPQQHDRRSHGTEETNGDQEPKRYASEAVGGNTFRQCMAAKQHNDLGIR